MKTQAQTLERKVFLYAEAKSQYQIDNLEPGELPFEYRVKEFDYGDESCVRIHEQAILVQVPEGIDITLACIKNLEEKITKIEEDAAIEVADLRKRIKALALIEYKPETPDE